MLLRKQQLEKTIIAPSPTGVIHFAIYAAFVTIDGDERQVGIGTLTAIAFAKQKQIIQHYSV